MWGGCSSNSVETDWGKTVFFTLSNIGKVGGMGKIDQGACVQFDLDMALRVFACLQISLADCWLELCARETTSDLVSAPVITYEDIPDFGYGSEGWLLIGPAVGPI
jgi:hypothetical protein